MKKTIRKPASKWQTSAAAEPCKVVARICKKSPTLPSKELIARCVKAGVSKNTANVRVCLFKKSK